LPLWLALLLKRQKRVNIFPPPWLNPDSLTEILELETKHFQDSFSPAPSISTPNQVDYDGKGFNPSTPFINASTIDAPPNALPYHWFEMSEMLLDAASDDLASPDDIRRLLRDIREVRLAKLRKGVEVLSGDGDGVRLNGVGAMEISESRGFITGVIDNLRKIGASREQARREREEEERENGRYAQYDDEDENMT
jgi:GINS complex subunit 2